MTELTAKNVLLKNSQGEVLIPYTGQSSSGAVGVPPSICTNLRVEKDGRNVALKWNDPNDTVIDGLTVCTWASTIIVRKQGGYPENEADGDVIVTNTVRNQYSNASYDDTLPDTTNDYFYRAFPVSANGAVCYDNANKFGGAIVYEFIINPANASPYGRIQYCGRNANFRPAKMDFTNGVFDYGDWENTFIMQSFKPVMLRSNGTVAYELNPYNVKQKLDGTTSDATNTSFDGNVMIQVAQIWIKEVNENGLQHIYIANQQVDNDYDCYTHVNANNNLVPYYYYAKYNGSNISNKYRSISGQAPANTLSGETQRQRCQANGSGWDTREYSFLRLMWYLHMLVGHSTDAQSVFGNGRYTGGSSASSTAQLTSGLNDDKGMFYGDNGSGTVTTFYIDNFWGNVWELTVGCIQKNGKLLYKMTPNTYDGSTATSYNNDGTGYIDSGVTCGQSASGQYIKGMTLVPKIGLVPSEYSGASQTTYYCDGFWTANVVGFLRSGGCSGSGGGFLSGLFAFGVYYVASHSDWAFGASLSYKDPS